MDLLKCDFNQFTGYDLIEGYDTLLWTERYSLPGEFSLTSSDIPMAQSQMPIGSLVCIRESNEVMMVDSHEVTSKDDVENITIKGTSLTAFLQHRVTLLPDDFGYVFRQQYTQAEVIAAYIWDAVVNPGEQSMEIVGPTGTPPLGQHWIMNNSGAANAIPNLIVSETNAGGSLAKWTYEGGTVLEIVTRLLQTYKLGLRSIRKGRPGGAGAQKVDFTIGAGLATSGQVQKVVIGDPDPPLRFDIYGGYDRTNQVIFNVDNDEIDGLTFFRSIADTKNVIYLTAKRWGTAGGWFNMWFDPWNATGLNRRVAKVDGGDVPGPDNLKLVDAENAVAPRMHAEHAARNGPVFLFDGEVQSAGNPYQYGVHYGLGDLVAIRGPYGLGGNMRVTEYIRNQEGSIESGYPTLAQA